MVRGMGGMGNMQGMMQKFQKMQKEMTKTQQAIEETVYEHQDNNNLVVGKMTGKKELVELTIAPELMDPEDTEMLQDLIIATVNQLIEKIDQDSEEKLGKYTKGLNLPF